MTHTIALPSTNKFEFLASILATWDNSEIGILNKRSALDQLLIRSEIDGYEKERINGDKNFLLWKKKGSDLAVLITRVEDGMYDVMVKTSNFIITSWNIEEL